MCATKLDQLEIFKYLVEECGADLTIKDVYEMDALYMAADYYNLGIICYIVNQMSPSYELMLAHPEFIVRACVKEIMFFEGKIEEIYNIKTGRQSENYNVHTTW